MRTPDPKNWYMGRRYDGMHAGHWIAATWMAFAVVTHVYVVGDFGDLVEVLP